jgi:hypothetical protein
MRAGLKLTGLLLAGALFLPMPGRADTPTAHRVHKAKKQPPLPPPLPSGTQGPVPQVPLDAIPAVPPEVSYQNGMLTIVAENSTLGDILRSVRKHTAAEIEIPSTANERVVTRLGPGPAREVVAELLNGSRFNYILLGSPDNASTLVRVVLVAKTPDTPAQPGQPGNPVAAANAADDNATAEVSEDAATEDSPDQPAAEAEQPAPAADQPPVKTPQQLLQEMQQRQMQMQQGLPGQPGVFPGRPGAAIPPGQPPQPQDQPNNN